VSEPPEPDDTLPGVSYVMPVLNEQDYIASAVASVLAQEYPGPAEVVLALGPSSDRTDAIVADLARSDERIRTVPNPRADIPIGLNAAIRAARYPIIVRVDAHAELPAGYTRRAVETLFRTGAANVGGIMLADGETGFQSAVARAYNSPLGLGGGDYHDVDASAGPNESAYLGVFRADALAAVGGYNEGLRRGEDWELNHRLIEAGYVVWLDPELRVVYRPRSSWTALARQFWATGIWRGELVRRLGRRNSLRFFAPPGLVLTAAAAVVPTRLRRPALLGLGVYAATIGSAAAREYPAPRDRLRYALVLATMHVSWGSGFLVGLVRGGAHTVDTSRAVPQPSQPSS
jgi:glycosyltransferase involved in cell wall biosynthesis